VIPATRAAQRGPDSWEQFYRALLCQTKSNERAEHFVNKHDLVDFVDFHCHSGDKEMAMMKFRSSGDTQLQSGFIFPHLEVEVEEEEERRREPEVTRA
jgi:hypothetical protein